MINEMSNLLTRSRKNKSTPKAIQQREQQLPRARAFLRLSSAIQQPCRAENKTHYFSIFTQLFISVLVNLFRSGTPFAEKSIQHNVL